MDAACFLNAYMCFFYVVSPEKMFELNRLGCSPWTEVASIYALAKLPQVDCRASTAGPGRMMRFWGFGFLQDFLVFFPIVSSLPMIFDEGFVDGLCHWLWFWR